MQLLYCYVACNYKVCLQSADSVVCTIYSSGKLYNVWCDHNQLPKFDANKVRAPTFSNRYIAQHTSLAFDGCQMLGLHYCMMHMLNTCTVCVYDLFIMLDPQPMKSKSNQVFFKCMCQLC